MAIQIAHFPYPYPPIQKEDAYEPLRKQRARHASRAPDGAASKRRDYGYLPADCAKCRAFPPVDKIKCELKSIGTADAL